MNNTSYIKPLNTRSEYPYLSGLQGWQGSDYNIQKSLAHQPGDGHRLVATRASVKDSNSKTTRTLASLNPQQTNNRTGKGNVNNKQNNESKSSVPCFKNDYSNHYIHSGVLPVKYVRNAIQPVEGYPKLQKLIKLKEQQVMKYATRAYGSRVKPEKMVDTLNKWIYEDNLQFDVIMIGALSENQLLYPLISQLPIDKLCAKPGFLFIWASTQKISELSKLLSNTGTWTKKFRRSEELVFVPVDKNSPFYPTDSLIPEEQLLEQMQWHCWMCITGTVRRSSDKNLIHCNINTDLSIENASTKNSAVPAQIYQVAENFSTSTKRLHIIPSKTGLDHPVKLRPGWVILSPDVMLDNFDALKYKKEIASLGSNIPLDDEIEQLRPKTPV
ncbi:hypothetical protein KL905_002546 [Ogataea polymorpha]|uniref:Karyogamy protein KAR4 n=1 Tax=Ogataea polymorpha TaxID=460523 RepID=A0A9P8SZV1_9ASCO|nr:hypothetical protein KL937_002134 [Ogataea polymorpha]KAG7894597.1 hypothetical protein KL908_001969 [Ogataea polymorpha]KAG7899810.1 hypothetical protein KL935_003351 [Ogataea polymorpha]KAG7906650.1 hypothetical protein KL907_002290 [Ogataea polymorpha]KAG7909897.1 hypothetical protein KL906_001802 [Ogataea polymorpha]